jgi:hypothetical protein
MNKNKVELAPLAMGLPDLPIRVVGLKAIGPDSDDNFNVSTKIVIRNDTAVDWGSLSYRAQLLTESGLYLSESSWTDTETVARGEETTLEIEFSAQACMTGARPMECQVVINVVACTLGRIPLSDISIPEEPWSMVPLKATGSLDAVSIVSACLYKTGIEEEDKSCGIYIHTLIQNHTQLQLSAVGLDGVVIDKKGAEISTFVENNEIAPGALMNITATEFVKAKKLAGASVKEMSLRVCCPVAAGVAQHAGMTITADNFE